MIQQAQPSHSPVVNHEDSRDHLIERILQNPRIPSPNGLALRVFQRAGQDDCTSQEISELLSHDAGLCAKILRAMNSAVYAQSKSVTSVQQAVTIMGMRPLRSLVLGLTLPVMQSNLKPDAGLQSLWLKSVTGAIIARELAKRCRLPAPDDIMAASLLRDLGMILLHQTFRQSYEPVWLGSPGISAKNQCEWEERHFSVHHADLSAALLERWQLPIEISEPIRFHHHPEKMPGRMQSLVNRAHLLSFVTRLAEMHENDQDERAFQEILRTAHKAFKLGRDELEELLGTIRPKVEEFSRILSVDVGSCPDFDELLSAGCEKMIHFSLEASKDALLAAPANGAATFCDQTTLTAKGPAIDDPENIAPGSRILQYEVLNVIGRGAMGIVLRARDTALDRDVALKLLAPEMSSNDIARRRFALEARFAAALRHEHVVSIYAVNEIDNLPFLVMEFVKGCSLEDLVEEGRTFSIAEIAQISRQTALGLAAAHEARLIHRDIKPANILVEDATLQVKVADFGLARAVDEQSNLSCPGFLLGTPMFMSPEQVDGKTLDAASDLFSLGSVIYTLCTGARPFEAETLMGVLNAVADKTPVPIREVRPEIPSALAAIVEKLHAKKPADRPPSALAVADAMKPWLGK